MKAASDLAQNLNANVSTIAYAGTKDKRGKTSQLFCMRKREPEKIARAAERLFNIHVGNFSFKPETLKLGVLKGNRFRIALRHITADKETIDQSLTSLKENGFINYYGLQRFGNNATIPTYEIGLALIKGQFREAVELIMKPRDGEAHFMKAVREHWWRHRDAAAALKMLFKTNTGIEAKLLVGLSKHGANDFVNALESIPRNMRLMYIHAYQSLIWNEVASRRVKLGLKVLSGDLVYVDEANQMPNEEEELILDVDADAGDAENEDKVNEKEPIEEVSRFKTMVKPLTAEDSGKYTIFDIVLPLPGHDISYPTNECGKWYEERLAKDELTSEKLKQKQKAYSLTGAYRKFIVKPDKLSWELTSYESETDNLIQSDLEEMKKEANPETAKGELQALVVDFCLPSSTYATMVLREILKEDTSPSNQTKLSQARKDSEIAAGNEQDSNGNGVTRDKKRKLDKVGDIECDNIDAKQIKLDTENGSKVDDDDASDKDDNNIDEDEAEMNDKEVKRGDE